MMENNDSYELKPEEFKHALDILKRERKVYSLSKWKKIAFAILNVSMLVFIAAVIGLIVLNQYKSFLSVVGGASIILSVIMFLAYLPGAIRIWRQNSKIKKMGLRSTFKKAWKMARKKSRVRNVIAILISIIGMTYLFSIVFVVIVIYNISSNKNLFWNEPIMLLGIVAMAIFCTPFISLHFLWKSRQRHDVISGLTAALGEKSIVSNSGTPAIPTIKQSDYHIIAELERSQILRDRAQSILADYSRNDFTYYSIQKSASFRRSMAGLDRQTRLTVNDFIEELADKQNFDESETKTETGADSLKVPGTDISISIKIDDSVQQLQILSLESSVGDDKRDSHPVEDSI